MTAFVLLFSCSAPKTGLPPDPPGDLEHHPAAVRAGDFWAAPWPGAGHFDQGRASLADFPNPSAVDLVADLSTMGDGTLDGAGTTSGVFFRSAVSIDPTSLPSLWESMSSTSPVQLVDVDPSSPERGRRFPITTDYRDNAGPFGGQRLLSLLPVQGVPLRPSTRYAAVVTAALRTGDRALNPWLGAAELEGGGCPEGYQDDCSAYQDALDELGIPAASIAGLAVFTTQDPTAELRRWTAHARATDPIPRPPSLELTEVFDDFCVFQGQIDVPVYQSGTPPYSTEGGDIVEDAAGLPLLDHREDARLVLTVPRGAGPNVPVAVFIRTGGGGDRPLVDRGVRGADGIPLEPGTGLAREFAQAGWAGLQIDGVHGGIRNVAGTDEQFLMFNVFNARALRDNVRQSALELALLPELVTGWSPVLEGCPDTDAVTFDTGKLALFGHSMGATIAPLTLALAPEYNALVLSGAGGSWIENVIHKRSPLEVRPVAEALLNYQGVSLHPHDPVLSLLQWVGESADPPVWGEAIRESPAHVLMVQGILDTYILPPIAKSTSLSLGLDLAGPPLDEDLPDYLPLSQLAPLVDGQLLSLPVTGNRAGATRVVIQHAEDGVEDGHEVMFQLAAPKATLVHFLETLETGVPTVQ